MREIEMTKTSVRSVLLRFLSMTAWGIYGAMNMSRASLLGERFGTSLSPNWLTNATTDWLRRTPVNGLTAFRMSC